MGSASGACGGDGPKGKALSAPNRGESTRRHAGPPEGISPKPLQMQRIGPSSVWAWPRGRTPYADCPLARRRRVREKCRQQDNRTNTNRNPVKQAARHTTRAAVPGRGSRWKRSIALAADSRSAGRRRAARRRCTVPATAAARSRCAAVSGRPWGESPATGFPVRRPSGLPPWSRRGRPGAWIRGATAGRRCRGPRRPERRPPLSCPRFLAQRSVARLPGFFAFYCRSSDAPSKTGGAATPYG